MEMKFVPLTTTSGSYPTSVIEGLLQAGGVPYTIRDPSSPTAFMGAESPIVFHEFLVQEERLQEAKDLLCANGVVCDVSEHLLSRALEEIVLPLLGMPAGGRDCSRLINFLDVNNRETVRALLEKTMEAEGGRLLVEEVFFGLDREENINSLRILAHVLGSKADLGFFTRLKGVMGSGRKREELAVLEVIREFPDTSERSQVLAIALRDSSLEIREAAEEALFSLGRGDYGYAADDDPEAREKAISKFLSIHG